METIAGFPFLPLTFADDGRPDGQENAALLAAITGDLEGVTDLFVISHGWNNDIADARTLYSTLLGNMRTLLDKGHAAGAGRRFAVVGVFWHSMKFVDEDLRPNAVPDDGAMGMDAPDVPTALLHEKLVRLQSLLGATDDALRPIQEAAAGLGEQPGAKAKFVKELRKLIPQPSDAADDNSATFLDLDADDLFDALKEPVGLIDPDGDEGGVASIGTGGADPDPEGAVASFGSLLAGVKAAAWRALNYTTYYVMKERAGTVGGGLNGVLGNVRQRGPKLRIHLIGHSFGARVVTAAAAGPARFAPASLSLLQGAFSHNGFAADVEGQTGFFRAVLTEQRVAGPIVATHTRNDKAVGIAYAIASRLSNDKVLDFGDASDVFGGIGRNGAVRMGAREAVAGTLGAETAIYPAFAHGCIQNLQADAYVSSHGDVTNPQVANAVLAATR